MNEEEKEFHERGRKELGNIVENLRESHVKYRDKIFALCVHNSIKPSEHKFLSNLFDAYIESNSRMSMELFAKNYRMPFSEVEGILDSYGLTVKN